MRARICVVGAGNWGRNHVRTLAELESLAGVVDRDEAALARIRAEYPQIHTYSNLRDALESPHFDGYTVATPAGSHFELARFILGHDQPLLVEKPLALRASEARQLVEQADRAGVLLMVGHVLLFHPAVRRIKELIDAGKIGKLQYLYSNRLNLGAVRTEENILWSFAPHDISVFQHLVGTRPTEIVARGGAFVQPHIHDSTMMVLTYPQNVVGHVFVSWLHPFKEHRMVVIGSKGMLSYEDSSAEKQILFYEKGIDWVQGEPIKRDGPTEVIPYDRRPALTEELASFVSHLRDRTAPKADGRSAVEVLEILERASASLCGERAAEAGRPERCGAAEPARREFFAHPSAAIGEQVSIGPGTKVWHFSHVQGNARIGRDCSLGQNVYVASNVVIGDSVKIQNNVSIYEGVTLEDYVFCGPSMVFTNVLDPRSKYPQRGSEHYRKTLVRCGASLGANCTIVCGVTIGRHAFVGAGAVVTRDVSDYALVVGSPARRVGWMCECGGRLPKRTGRAACERCGREYQLSSERAEAHV